MGRFCELLYQELQGDLPRRVSAITVSSMELLMQGNRVKNRSTCVTANGNKAECDGHFIFIGEGDSEEIEGTGAFCQGLAANSSKPPGMLPKLAVPQLACCQGRTLIRFLAGFWLAFMICTVLGCYQPFKYWSQQLNCKEGFRSKSRLPHLSDALKRTSHLRCSKLQRTVQTMVLEQLNGFVTLENVD